MAKAFSVISWNVEHFGATDKNRTKPTKAIAPIIKYIADQKADVVGIYEVVGSMVFDEVTNAMPDYHWHITEGPQVQEILIGVKKGFSSFFTQKVAFKSGQSTLRPGALLTIKLEGQIYPLLFLHLKSLTDPKGFGLRDDMTEKALKFIKTLKKVGNQDPNYIFMGDLNTMGMNLTYNDKDISGPEELQRLITRATKRSLKVLSKSHEATHFPKPKAKYGPSDLDHVVAANHLQFKLFDGKAVDVRGWSREATKAKQRAWANKYSDHALLYFEVQKV
jgi:hypothetical protein